MTSKADWGLQDQGDTGKDNEAQQGEEEQTEEAIQATDDIADMVIAVGSIRPT